MKSLEIARGSGCILGNIFFFISNSRVVGSGIDTTVTGGGVPFGEKWDCRPRSSLDGWAGPAMLEMACIFCLTKHSALIYPGRNPRPRALMDLGMNGAQSEMVSNTQL